MIGLLILIGIAVGVYFVYQKVKKLEERIDDISPPKK